MASLKSISLPGVQYHAHDSVRHPEGGGLYTCPSTLCLGPPTSLKGELGRTVTKTTQLPFWKPSAQA